MTAFYSTAEYATAEVPNTGLSLSCDAASFAVSAKPALLPRSIAAGVAAFALTGLAAFGAGSLIAGAAAFALSGKAIAAPIASTAASAAFTISGQPVQMAMASAPAAFTASGQAAGLVISQALGKASFVLAGQTVQAAMPVASATFVLTGIDANSMAGQVLAPAVFTIFGKPVFREFKIGFIPGEPATAEYGTAEFPRLQAYQVASAPASYAWIGQSALLTAAPEAAAFILTGGPANQAIGNGPAAFSVTGQPILSQFAAIASKASFVLTPQSWQSFLPLPAAAFTSSGQDILLRESLLRAQFILTGQDVFSIKWLGCAPGAFTWAPQILRSALSMSAGRASFTFIGWSVVDVTGPSGDHVYLVEVQYHDGISLKTAYLGTEGITSLPGDNPPNQYYEPRIVDPGNFQRALFDGADLRGRAKAGSGDIVIATADPGNGETLDAWFTYGWSRRSIRIMSLPRGAKSLAAASTLFFGKLDRITSTKPLEQLSLRIGDRLADLQAPLLTDLYAGTTLSSGTTAEGNGDLKGKIKQRCWGSCSNVPLQPVNPYDLIYLASNGAISSIAVYDGGASLTYDGDSVDLIALRAASVSPGHYRSCLAAGLVRIGALPDKTLTADVVEGPTAASRSASQIAYRMLRTYGIAATAISTGSFAALDAKNSAECCYFLDSDRDALSAIQDVLDSVGGWMVPDRDGTFVVGRFEAPSIAPQSTFELDAVALGDSLDSVDSDLPAWRVLLQFAPVFTVQGDNDVLPAPAVSAERRAYLSKDFRTTTAENVAVQIKHLSAREITIKTYLVNPDDAASEAARQLLLLSADRQRLNITMPLADAWPSTPGNSITLRNPRLGLSAGKPFTVLNRVDSYQNDTVEFALWG